MSWGKEPNSDLLGVALNDLVSLLRPTTIEVSLEGSTLRARHEHYTVLVDVLPPDVNDSSSDEIQAIVRLTTSLPPQLAKIYNTPEVAATMNRFASLGSLLIDDEKVYVGSRLTIYKAEDAWASLHLPLLLFTIVSGAEPILGAMRRSFNKEGGRGGGSAWIEDDFKQVEEHLSQVCVCSNGGLGFTAEFGLSPGSSSVIMGNRDTALFRLIGDQPHPEAGGGLFSQLEMPHRFDGKKQLHKACMQLNKMEMAPHDLSPHFGAWCEGSLGNNLSYVSFLPNALHSVPGVAVNLAIWALARAQWASSILESYVNEDDGIAERKGTSESNSSRTSSTKTAGRGEMHDIEMPEVTNEFAECWQAAGSHLQSMGQGTNLNWLKSDLNPPFLEHLSLGMGNQLFYVRVVDVDNQVQGPGNKNGFRTIAEGCKGHACLMPMRRVGGAWQPNATGWGLINPDNGMPIDPAELVTDERIEMTDWELHDFVVQIVRDYITQKLGYELMSSQGNPAVDPSIWFVGDQGPEWVVVRAARYPEREAKPPSNMKQIAQSCEHLSRNGHFASVGCANAEDDFGSTDQDRVLPLWRGHGIFVRFQGLVPATVQ